MHDNRRTPEWIASHLGPGAMSPWATTALRRLGYRFEPAAQNPAEGHPSSGVRPQLHLVDDRRPQDWPSPDSDPETPIILVTGSRGMASPDARVAGQVTRPAALHDLYPLLQHALEMEPRRAPRVTTRLSARCLGPNGSRSGQIVSLSLHGCRFRGAISIESGQMATLRIAIPRAGFIHSRARCAWSREGQTGFEFIRPEARAERIIGQYVTFRLGGEATWLRDGPGEAGNWPSNPDLANGECDGDPKLDRRRL